MVDTRFDKKYRIEIVLTKEVGARSVEELTGNKREKEVLIPTRVCFQVEKYEEAGDVVNIKLVPVVPDSAGRRRGIGFSALAADRRR